MAAAVTAGIVADSLALLSDAAHMLTDAVAIALALLALRLARRPPAGSFTYGMKRAEILSAAIKAVPTELTEAAKVDGANESQTFWQITLPQIAPTLGVVVTALFVTVMKVFDIVYAMTNGNFGTQVIANQMWTSAFGQSNLGLGSALAVVLFASVIPIMWINIRRTQRASS